MLSRFAPHQTRMEPLGADRAGCSEYSDLRWAVS